jgi:hypothetical protein
MLLATSFHVFCTFNNTSHQVRRGGTTMFDTRKWPRFVFLTVVLISASFVFAGQNSERVIVSSSGSRDALKSTIQNLGGQITQEYQNVNAVAAVIPASAKTALDAVSEFKVTKDAVTALEPPASDPRNKNHRQLELQADDVFSVEPDALKDLQTPNDYPFNNELINAASVQAGGNLGDGIIVAVIDSGTSAFASVLTGTVIGGENFSGDGISANSRNNGPHGTWVGTMIAGHGFFGASKTGCTGRVFAHYIPSSLIDGANPPFNNPAIWVLPVTGVAPAAKIYALKVFPATSDSAPSSNIIAAMDRAITLKKNYLAGKPQTPVSGTGTESDPYVYDSLNIKVVNMSLGGPTLIAGRDVEDQLVEQMVKVGITVATSTGNAGPSGLTTGSPSTSFASIPTAAATTPTHERIVASLFFNTPGVCDPAFGELWRPTEHIQTALFSSRGPTADGRFGVGVTSAGDWNFAQGANGGFSFVSGTSFSSPTVAGAAALIRKAVPNASAAQVRNAIILGANPHMLGDKSTVFDQGAGYLDVAHSINLLKHTWVPGWILPSIFPSGEVERNIERLGLRVQDAEVHRPLNGSAHNLLPGQRREFYVEVEKGIGSITLSINGVTPTNPPSSQNQLFGDDLIVNVHSAKTSSIGEGDYLVPSAFVSGAKSFTIPNPESGIMRVTLTGDWTNAGTVSADFTLTATKKERPDFSKYGTVGEGETIAIPFTVAPGTSEAAFELTWTHDWASYPTNDLDMILVDPNGKTNFDGATINGLERAVITKPTAGTWQILVNGFTIYDRIGFDRWKKSRNDNTDNFKVAVFTK